MLKFVILRRNKSYAGKFISQIAPTGRRLAFGILRNLNSNSSIASNSSASSSNNNNCNNNNSSNNNNRPEEIVIRPRRFTFGRIHLRRHTISESFLPTRLITNRATDRESILHVWNYFEVCFFEKWLISFPSWVNNHQLVFLFACFKKTKRITAAN